MNSTNSAILAKLLGAFFYYPPDSQMVKPLIAALLHLDQFPEWQNPSLINKQCGILTDEINNNPELDYQYSVLFEGQGTMPIPPWGSVYLDKEHLLMGESQERYRQFLKQHGIKLNTGMNEPEDQFGLMLLALAMLLDKNKTDTAKQLITDHLLTWSSIYLDRLKQNNISRFYQALAIIAEQYLQML